MSTTFLSPHLLPKPFFTPYPSLLTRPHYPTQTQTQTQTRTSLVVAKFGFLSSAHLPDPEHLRDLFGRTERILYTLADAQVIDNTTAATTKQDGDWLSGITSSMETILKVLKDGLTTLHVPYSYGFAIILLTVLVKAATFPLSKKQVESAMAMRSLQPQIKAIQKRYAGDKERIQLETARLYKLAGINPLAGCLPTLATIPVWIGLYRALSNVANEGLLTEGFFWIPSLAGPTTVADRQNGSGISWLFPFVDGHPPLGWSDTAAYLVLPVLLIVSQYISIQIMQSSQPNDPNVKSSQAITNFLPLMIGYFSLSVPSGLSLYWLTNNLLSTLQQVWLQKMGGAKNPVGQISNDVFKEEQSLPQPPETVVQTKSIQTEVKPPSTGPLPGERFKQLKEEEARRKKQLEEQKMRAEDRQDNMVETANGTTAGLVGKDKTDQPRASIADDSNNIISAIGDANGMPSKEHHDTSNGTKENGRPTDEITDINVSDDLEKEVVEVYNRTGPKERSFGDETS